MRGIAVLILVFSLCANLKAQGENLLTNGSFEEDAANVGFPDHWSSPQASSIETTKSTDERGRVVRIKADKASLAQILTTDAVPAGGTLQLSVLARGDGARVSAALHYKDVRGEAHDIPFLVGTAAPKDWASLTGAISVPKDAKMTEAELVLSKDEGAGDLYLDDAVLTSGDLGAGAIGVVHEIREWEYLGKQAGTIMDAALRKKIAARSGDVAALLGKKTKDVLAAIPELQKERRLLALSLLQAMAGKGVFAARLSNPLERLNPGSLEWLKDRASEPQSILEAEPSLVGFTLANLQAESMEIKLQVSIDGTPHEVSLRRQVFLNTWYTRGKTRVADPLVLCPRSGSDWAVRLESAEEAAFLVEVPPLSTGRHEIKIRLLAGNATEELKSSINVLPATLPKDGNRLFEYMAFCYPGQSFMKDPIEDSIKDMEKLGVTAFQFPFLPKAKVKKTGELVSIQWEGFHGKWLAALQNSPLAVVLFFEPGMKSLEDENGNVIPFGSPEWERAYTEILQSFVQMAGRHGVSPDRIINLAKDEAFSKDQHAAPDENMRRAIQAFQVSKKAVPEVRTMATVTYYACYADLVALLPYMDIAMPHWPYPEKLTRYASPSYNPKKAWLEQIKPLFFEERKRRNLEVWSYHVANGKSNDPLKRNLAYPTMAAAAGLTGAGHWAYAAAYGSTWDDSDGKILDYILAYDGQDNHPLNREWNTTGERIVPSIRWFAMREGLRDARILCYLQGQPPSIPVENLLQEIRKVGGEDSYGTDALTYGWYNQYRSKLRDLYAGMAPRKGNP